MQKLSFCQDLESFVYKKAGHSNPNISIISNLKEKVNSFSSDFTVSAFYINKLS